MTETWFTADDLEEVLWLDRGQIESRLIDDGRILPEERHEQWAVDLRYMDRLVLTMLGRLPDKADLPRDNAASLLLRYALVLVDKRQCYPASDGAMPSFEEVRCELAEWEDRIRPHLRAQRNSARSMALPQLATAIHVA